MGILGVKMCTLLKERRLCNKKGWFLMFLYWDSHSLSMEYWYGVHTFYSYPLSTSKWYILCIFYLILICRYHAYLCSLFTLMASIDLFGIGIWLMILLFLEYTHFSLVWALLSFYKYGCLKVSSFSLVWALDDIKGHELHVNLPLLLFFP